MGTPQVFSGRVRAASALKVVCAEADAGWALHYMYRDLDHAYKRHRYWMKAPAAGQAAEQSTSRRTST